MSILINLAAEFTGKKAFDKADKSVVNLEKSAKKLAKTLGFSLSAATVVAFGKASAKAFMEDEKQAAKLANTINNLGLGFANPAIATYIDQLQKMTGVADSELRPALQALIQQTGSLAKSQELLNLAISVSRGSGESLSTVTNDLAQAYVGNTRGLRKYYLGLTQAELKTTSFVDLQERLNKQFSGANSAYLNTYAGQMQLLATAAGEAQETIGKGLIDSLAVLGKDGSVNDLANSMQELADFTSNTVYGIASLTAEMKKLGGATPSWLKAIVGSFAGSTPVDTLLDAVKGLSAYGERKQNAKLENPSTLMFKQDMANFRLGKEKLKNDNKILKSQKALVAEQKKQAALKKAGTVFDLEQIGLVAALKGKLSVEERLRIEAQLALLNDNEAVATKLTKQIIAAQTGGEELAAFLAKLPDAKNPFEAWKSYLSEVELQAKRIASMTIAPTAPSSNGQGLDFGGNVIGSPVPNFVPPANGTYGTTANVPPIVVQIEGKTIASVLMDQSLSSGNQAYINRRTGGFE